MSRIESLKNKAKLLEEIPVEIAKAARDLHRAIKQWYPVKGQPWRYGRSHSNLILHAQCGVYNALHRLFKLLDHDRKSTLSNPLECPLRFTHRWPPNAISWRDLLDAFITLAEDVHSIALHYGWADLLCNDRGPLTLPGKWPNVPKIPADLLQSLLDHADTIDALTLPCLREIREKINQPAPVYVDLDQIAAVVNRSKSTLEKLKRRKDNPLPDPDVPGGGGKKDEWVWSHICPWLETEFKKHFAETLPRRL